MNRLALERSPYLLQHAANPVDWYPWGDDALARARVEDKPIFLSIGYSTCHWCHVMEHESFVNGAIAEALNRSFVSIKVDREERPDVDRVYMAFVQATTGSGGWPMTVFLTPDLKPFYGGTYFPPASRWGRPGFLDLLPGRQSCRCCGVATLLRGLAQIVEGLDELAEASQDPASVFAIGPDLEVREHTLLLEGPSDLIYLDVLTDVVEANGSTGLDPRWVETPIGGSGKLSTFAPEAKVIHADIDPAEIGKNRNADVPIVGAINAVW